MGAREVSQVADDVITVEGVRKAFAVGDGETLAIEDVSVSLREGEFVSIVGPSGCGKTTLLRCVSGLVPIDRGEIHYRGERVSGVLPALQIVFQEYNRSLFPWLKVDRNVRFPLHGIDLREADERVAEAIRLVHLEGFEGHYPWQLSGGMQQRVAIARSVAARAELLLMDEPFASVDAQTRMTLQEELLRIWQERRTTVVFITHDVSEAVFLANRVISSRDPKGSSMSNSDGRVTRERAIATRCCMPPES